MCTKLKAGDRQNSSHNLSVWMASCIPVLSSDLCLCVQINDIAAVKVLLAFGADINPVNHRRHTPLDIATYSWVAQERETKVRSGTNNLATVQEGLLATKLHTFTSFPDASSPMSSPYLYKRKASRVQTRTDSESSWIYVDRESKSPSPNDNKRESQSQLSSDDSREFTSSVMPIKPADLVQEVASMEEGSASQKSFEPLLNLLYSVHALSGKAITHHFRTLPPLKSFSESNEFQQSINAQQKLNPFWDSGDLESSIKIRDYLEGKTVFNLYEELDYNINLKLVTQTSLSPNPDEAIAITLQQREMMHFKMTGKGGIGFEVKGGSRLLFLDGGGIKGLVQIEVMRQLEEATGRKITELFDWIVGTSVGGILALGLVYGEERCMHGRGWRDSACTM